MKHTPKIVFVLLALFFVAQIVGLLVTSHYLKVTTLPMNIERPQMEATTAFFPIFLLILFATVLALLLFKFRLFRVWKIWFLFSVWFTLTISFSVFFAEKIAMILAAVFAFLKSFRPTVLLHNFTELFIYGALAAIFVPILNLASVSILLTGISVYDYIAVRKTKHMIKLAKSQNKTKVFAGLAIPYEKKIAILGGGDIGFALLFAGVVMKEFSFNWLSLGAMIVPLCTSGALFYLFYKGKDKKFYPAMPYITAGAFIGLGIVSLINILV
ncbi:MAG: presenilin family intramembrane aspartyl protease [archaeon]